MKCNDSVDQVGIDFIAPATSVMIEITYALNEVFDFLTVAAIP